MMVGGKVWMGGPVAVDLPWIVPHMDPVFESSLCALGVMNQLGYAIHESPYGINLEVCTSGLFRL